MQAEVVDETANIKEAGLHADEVSVETTIRHVAPGSDILFHADEVSVGTESVNDFNETIDDVTIASVRPVESLPTALPSPKFNTEKTEPEVFTSVEELLSHYVAAAPLKAPEITPSDIRLSGKDHRLESPQPDVNIIELEPELCRYRGLCAARESDGVSCLRIKIVWNEFVKAFQSIVNQIKLHHAVCVSSFAPDCFKRRAVLRENRAKAALHFFASCNFVKRPNR